MERTISKNDERKLTSAVERAATLVSGNTARDCDSTLANCLMDEGVDARFAKTAAAAFNKRLTVLNFQTTDDAGRGESFPLANPSAVSAQMGMPVKTASYTPTVVNSFTGEMRRHTPQVFMRKSASAKVMPAKPRLEDTMSKEGYKNHVNSMLVKFAAEFQHMTGDLDVIRGRIQERQTKLAHTLDRLSDFDHQTICNVYGDALKDAMEGIPMRRPIIKIASSVDPDNMASRQASALICDMLQRDIMKDEIAEMSKHLKGYTQAAMLFAKTAATDVNAETADDMPMPWGTAIGGASAAILGTGTAAARSLVGTATGLAQKGIREGIHGLNHGLSSIEQSKSLNKSPSLVITPSFLTKDRMLDRMLAFNDMQADPQFSSYKTKDIFSAVNKAMDIDNSLENAGSREHLRTVVGQLLAQNNRASLSDVAALATISSDRARGLNNEAISAAEAVKRLEDVNVPDASDVVYISPMFEEDTGDHGDFVSVLKDSASNVGKLIDAQKERTFKAKKKTQREIDALAKTRKAQDAEIEKLLQQANIHASYNHSTGRTEYYQNVTYLVKNKDGNVIDTKTINMPVTEGFVNDTLRKRKVSRDELHENTRNALFTTA